MRSRMMRSRIKCKPVNPKINYNLALMLNLKPPAKETL